MVDIAEVLINGRDISIDHVGIRPGEKVHEIMVSEEECYRTIERDGYYVICPVLPELRRAPIRQLALNEEYSSQHVPLAHKRLHGLLAPYIEAELKGVQA